MHVHLKRDPLSGSRWVYSHYPKYMYCIRVTHLRVSCRLLELRPLSKGDLLGQHVGNGARVSKGLCEYCALLGSEVRVRGL